MKMMGSCKFEACSISQNPIPNQSIRVSFNNCKIPKSLSFSNSKPRKLCCSSSSSSSSRFSSPTRILLKSLAWPKFNGRDKAEFVQNFLIRLRNIFYDHFVRQVLFVTVVLLDEDQQLKHKFDELAVKASNETNPHTEANIVFDEVIPLLLKNADGWVSSRLMVSTNQKEALLKVTESEQMNTNKYMLPPDVDEVDFDVPRIEANALNTVRCIEVIMDLSTIGVIDVKLTEIQSRDDFKTLLLHLMSMAGIVDASVTCFSGLVLKEKAEVLESYSHATT